MRAKQVLSRCNIPAKASLVWSRITFSRLTTAYFVVAVIHCIIQVILQVQAFSINAAAANGLWHLVQGANETQEANGFAILDNDLRICYKVPNTINVDSCQVIWGGNNQSSGPSYGIAAASLSASVTPSPTLVANAANNSISVATLAASVNTPVTSSTSQSSSSLATTEGSASSSTKTALRSTSSSAPTVTVVITPTSNAGKATVVIPNPDDDNDDDDDGEDIQLVRARSFKNKRMLQVSPNVVNGETVGVNVHGLQSVAGSQFLSASTNVQLSNTCIKTLIWPVQKLNNTKREDITLIGFQVWVLGMSIVALLNESIPHICTALVTHLLVTIWTVFQVFETEQFRQDFARLTTNGACRPNNLLGSYWEQRKDAEIPSAVLNGVALLVSAFLTYKLMKIYGWQTFKRVGASLTINRIYKLVLSLSIAIQLALFFIVSAAALWIDQLYNGAIGRLATLGPVYKGGIILVFCLLIPWLSLGWFAIRREKRKLALAFLVLSLLFIGLWAAMFKSISFRWTFVVWPFFAVMAVVSGTLMIVTFILGVACRFNFGKGLPRYLNAEEPLAGNDFTPVFPEQRDFYDDPEKVDFPSSNGRPIPTFSATFGKGSEVPRPTQMHFGPSRGPGKDMYGGTQVSHQRGESIARSVSSSISGSHLARTDTRDSQMTYNSESSTSSGRTDILGKRWVIE